MKKFEVSLIFKETYLEEGFERVGMEKKNRLAEMRCRLLARTSELDLSFATEMKIARIVQQSASEQDHETREAKAEEILNLLADCRDEEDVLKKLI